MTIINHEYYVSLEIAKLLKEAGFDWETEFGQHIWDRGKRLETNRNFNSEKYLVSLPTLEVAQRWFREVKAIHICVKPNEASSNCKYFTTVIVNETKWGNIQDDNRKTIMFYTYEEAQEAGIKKALELILKKG